MVVQHEAQLERIISAKYLVTAQFLGGAVSQNVNITGAHLGQNESEAVSNRNMTTPLGTYEEAKRGLDLIQKTSNQPE